MAAPKCTPTARKKICDAIAAHGYSHVIAAAAAGIHEWTMKDWIRKGQQDIRENRRSRYRNLFESIAAAREVFERTHLDQVIAASTTGIPEVFEETKVAADGSTTVTKRRKMTRSWQASAWLLERRFPERYAQRRITEGTLEIEDKREPTTARVTLELVDPPQLPEGTEDPAADPAIIEGEVREIPEEAAS